MKYFKQYNNEDYSFEISKERARETLTGWYKESFVNEIIDEGKPFRLNTPVSTIYTMSKDGLTPQAGFYGVCE